MLLNRWARMQGIGKTSTYNYIFRQLNKIILFIFYISYLINDQSKQGFSGWGQGSVNSCQTAPQTRTRNLGANSYQIRFGIKINLKVITFRMTLHLSLRPRLFGLHPSEKTSITYNMSTGKTRLFRKRTASKRLNFT